MRPSATARNNAPSGQLVGSWIAIQGQHLNAAIAAVGNIDPVMRAAEE
jgi:hypothetical protein